MIKDVKQKGVSSTVFISVILLAIVFCNCNSGSVYKGDKSFDRFGWYKDSLLVFNFEVTDTAVPLNLYLNVRNEGAYEYSNLWLFTSVSRSSDTVFSDTLELTLADHTGKWRGRSGLSDLYSKQYEYKKQVHFPISGSYSVNFQHGMRTDSGYIKGIRNIGLVIEAAEQ